MKLRVPRFKIQDSGLKTRVSRFTLHASRFTFHEKGFTLIELLISITIIGVLSSLVLVNMSFGNRQQNLSRAAQQLALDIRRAQNLSLAPTNPPACLYGLHFLSATQYVLYGKPSPCPMPRSNPNNNQYSAINDTLLETVTIGNGIAITNNPSVQVDIAFEAPEPITYLKGNTNSASLGIILQSPDNTSKTVTVNRFGQVEIQ